MPDAPHTPPSPACRPTASRTPATWLSARTGSPPDRRRLHRRDRTPARPGRRHRPRPDHRRVRAGPGRPAAGRRRGRVDRPPGATPAGTEVAATAAQVTATFAPAPRQSRCGFGRGHRYHHRGRPGRRRPQPAAHPSATPSRREARPGYASSSPTPKKLRALAAIRGYRADPAQPGQSRTTWPMRSAGSKVEAPG